MDTSLAFILLTGCSLAVAEVQLIDLTHVFGYKTVYWPLNPPYNFSTAFTMDRGGEVQIISNYFQTAEHSGTHMDAPRHFCASGIHVHQVPLEKLSGPGVVLDFEAEAKNRDFEITIEHLKTWEENNGMIPEGAIVIMKFGWNKFWPDLKKVWGNDDVYDTANFHYPGMTGDASSWLARERKINALGTDCPSPDPAQSTEFEVHVNLLCDYGVIIIENVGNIDALPVTGSRVYIGAIKLENGSGTPVRLFAILGSGCSSFSHFNMYFILIAFSAIKWLYW